jgi:hypothetical protein
MQATKLPNQASSHVNARTMMELMHSAALDYADQSHDCIVGHNAIIEWQDRGETSSAIYKVSTFSTFPCWSLSPPHARRQGPSSSTPVAA